MMALNLEGQVLSGIKRENGLSAEEVQGIPSDDLESSCGTSMEPAHPCDCGDCEAEKVSDNIVDLLPTDPFSRLHSCNFDCKAEKVYDNIVDLLPTDPFSTLHPCNFDFKAEKVYDNIVDLLPTDPFDMHMSATVTAITGWFEDLDMKNFDFESVLAGLEDVDDPMVAELNIIWKGRAKFHSNMLQAKCSPGFEVEHEDQLLVDGNLEDLMSFISDKYCSPNDAYGEHIGCVENNLGTELGPPPDALFFVLGYLGVRDLLSIERVCKSLHEAVQTDPLLWRNIHIDYPLSDKITDDVLLHLTERAQGSLHSLSLVNCLNLTDHGFRRLLETNTRLTQLNVVGCLRLSIECIIGNLKLFKSVARPGIKCLRIGGIFGVTSQNFEELKLILNDENQKLPGALKPRFFQAGQLYLSFDDDRYIDIESCPRCQHVRQVYDCPADSCRGKWNTPQACRACTLCVSRCINCGRCLSNCDYEETFCLDPICLDCWKELFNCQEKYSSFCPSTVVVIRRQVATLPSMDVGIAYS